MIPEGGRRREALPRGHCRSGSHMLRELSAEGRVYLQVGGAEALPRGCCWYDSHILRELSAESRVYL